MVAGWRFQDLGAGSGPHARVAAIVPAGDAGPDPLVRLGHRNDDGPMQGLAFDEPEPRLMSTTDEY